MRRKRRTERVPVSNRLGAAKAEAMKMFKTVCVMRQARDARTGTEREILPAVRRKEKMPITARDSRRMAWAGLRTEKTSLPGKKRSKSLTLAATHAVRKMDAGFPLAAKARLMK